MSLFIAGAIAGASLIAGLLVAMSEQIRVALCRRRDEQCLANVIGPSGVPLCSGVSEASTVSPESRAAAYREILDALGDELDDDIAEWEAVLEDFPQVIGAEDVLAEDARSHQSMVETAHESTIADSLPAHKSMTPLHRTRRVSAEECGMIQRLLRTGFAPEEIALWLNLPLERVQEVLLRD